MSLNLILGPMKSGKSLEIISVTSPLIHTNRKILYVNSKTNTRDKGISSRTGISIDAISVSALNDIKDDFDVIVIDEIHMFNPSDVEIISSWLEASKDIYISGLDLDYRGKMFEIIIKLLELKPESVVFKKAVCDVCNIYMARFTQIVDKDTHEPILSGLPSIIPEDNNYDFQARCRICFIKS